MFDNICNNCLSNCSQAISCNKRKCELSILNSVTTSSVEVQSGSAIPFNANRVCLSEDIFHVAGSSDFTICTPGVYKATVTTNARLSLGETINSVSIALAVNGLEIPGSRANDSCGPNDTRNLTTQVVFVIVNGTTAILTSINPNTNTPLTLYDNTNIIVEKIG